MITLSMILSAILLCAHIPRVRCQLPLQPDDKNPKCDLSCEDEEPSLVCGTDGRTYRSPCEIERAKCEGYPVKVKNEGKCSGSPNCFDVRRLALAQAAEGNRRVTIPECEEDGSYMEVQCHRTTGYCWCVDDNGKHVQGTSVKNMQPNCGKRTNKRRSSSRRRRKGCSSTDKTTFNNNLVKIFKSEYDRLENPPGVGMYHQNPPSAGLLLNQETQRVIIWKFDQLDTNKDNVLRRREVRDLRRMAKKIIEPRQCAKTFIRHCDFDHDKKISQVEWSKCLVTDLSSDTVKTQRQPSSQLHPAPTRPTFIQESDEGLLEKCKVARKKALETQGTSPRSRVYVPECKKNGHYKDTQCFKNKSKAVCWCVRTTDGKPILGTTSHSGRPRCRKLRRTAKMFKGCRIHNKHIFLNEFLEYLGNEMTISTRNISSSTAEKPTNEQAARWKFKDLDLNNNEVLERRGKEWKTFRRSWKHFRKSKRSRKRLKKCWRNLLWYCDKIGNNDNNVNLREWLQCIEVERVRIKTPGDAVKGKNPFKRILKPLQAR